MTGTVLVLNSGSSSLKYQLVEPESGRSIFSGIVERIGEETSTAKLKLQDSPISREGRVDDHEAALRLAFELVEEGGESIADLGVVAVGHRVVHGGPTLYRPTVIDDATVAELEEFFNFVESAGGPGGALPAEARETMERWFPDLARFLETHTGGGGGAGGGGEEEGGGGEELEEEEEEEEEEVGRS